MKIGITGYRGRMGQMLVRELLSGNFDASLAGGSYAPDEEARDEAFFTTQNAAELFEKSDAVIDFTIPKATEEHITIARETSTPLVIGTTGLSDAQEDLLKQASARIPVVYAANYSVGVNVTLSLIEKAAAILQDGWDIEIFETHHKHKIDAPSGTALAMGKAAAQGREVDLNSVADYARHGETGARKDGAIGFSVARGGDVVGDHSAYFYGEGETVEIRHQATNRALFARGAIRAAIWAKDQKAGLYSMRDVLNLN